MTSPARRFSSRLWHFNAYVIAIAGLMAILVGLAGLFEIGRTIFRTRHVQNVVSAPSQSKGDQSPGGTPVVERIGSFTPLSGTSLLRAPIRTSQRRQLSRYSKVATGLRNFIFYNRQTGNFQRLLPNEKSLIMSYSDMYAPPSSSSNGSAKTLKAMSFLVVEKDSNDDGVLTGRDEATLVIVLPDGLRKLRVDNIGEMLGRPVLNDNELVLIRRARRIPNDKKPAPAPAPAPAPLEAIHIAIDTLKITARHSAK